MLVLALSGCVFPTRLADKPPFGDEVTGFVELGKTTKNEAENSLGTPDETYANGQWWVFRAYRKTTEWFGFFCAPTGCGGGDFGGDPDQYYLLVHFDQNDTVQHTSVVNKSKPCDENYGVCYEDRTFYLSAKAHLLDLSSNNRCPLALFTPNSIREFWTMRVLLDGRQPAYRFRHADTRALIMWLKPGPHEVSVTYGYDADEVSKSIRLDCVAPEFAYLSAQIVKDHLKTLDLIPAEDGIRHIADRKLVPMADIAIE